MYNAAIVAGLVGTDFRFLLQHRQGTARISRVDCQRARQADNASTDHRYVKCFFHALDYIIKSPDKA